MDDEYRRGKGVEAILRHRRQLGAVFWVLASQYFIVQLFVAHDWLSPYSLAHNTISDLGNTACGLYGKAYVCSPAHGWMNASFILLGITQAGGAALLYRKSSNNLANLGFDGMILAGLGTLLVGLFPENISAGPHILGAGLIFLFGNIAMVLLGRSLKLPPVLKNYCLVSGYLGLVALVLLLAHRYLGLGVGGMERLTAYPQTVWLIILGTYYLLGSKAKAQRLG